MRKPVFATALLLISALALAQLPTTTTLSEQTANNTSAPDGFTAQSNGNLGAGNISKLPIRSLLYPGATTKIYAHVVPWWGSRNHISVGYSSQDPAQVHRQVQDMVSRGIDGVIVDWYGPGSYEDIGVKLLLAEAAATPDFSVLVEIDVGAVNWFSCYPTCSATTAVINLFTEANTRFFSSPAIAKLEGRPLLMEFGMETLSLPTGAPSGWNIVDWSAVQAQTPGNLAIVHRNLGGYSKAQSTGAFAWMEPKTLSNFTAGFDGTVDLNWFYWNSISSFPTMSSYGAVWKGFDDTLASWAPVGGRHIDQNCGTTWLNTFTAINQYYSSTRQLPSMQLVTWNDYEEGSALETGIDNCLNLTASLDGKQLQWNPGGDEVTIDHYTVYASTDGENLASLGEFTAGVHALDLSTVALAAGKYSVYVQAVGKPTIRNHMSAAISYTVKAERRRPGVPKNLTLSANPPTQSVAVGASARYTLTVAEEGASDPVDISCSGLPEGMECSFSSTTVTPDSLGTEVQMSVNTVADTAQSNHSAPVWAMVFSGLGLLGFGATSTVRHRRKIAAGMMLFGLVLSQIACGGGATRTAAASNAPTAAEAAKTYTITVNAVSGAVSKSTVVTLTVN